MKVNIICFTARGAEIINRIQNALSNGIPDKAIEGVCDTESEGYKRVDITITGYIKCSSINPADDAFSQLKIWNGSLDELAEASFTKGCPLIFIGAAGIAVRAIAPYIKNKLNDIPVIVIDENGDYVIPILSGHAGGGVTLAKYVAKLIAATPVITTATDVNETFAIDIYAKENRLDIKNKEAIKQVSAKVLKGEPIIISIKDYSPFDSSDVVISDDQIAEGSLWLAPKRYVLGIGCKKGKTCEEIEALVLEELCKLKLGYEDIYAFGSIDLKESEEGLRDFSARHRIPFVTFSADMLMRVEGDFSASDFVREQVGVDNVCERAAAILAGGADRLVAGKTAKNGVTVAVGRRNRI